MHEINKQERTHASARKTRVFKRSVPLWAFIIAVVALVAVFSATYFTLQIGSYMTIRADYTLELWNEEYTAKVTSVQWNEFTALNEVQTKLFWVKTVGSIESRMSWNTTDFPETQFSLTCEYYEVGPNQWFELPKNTACPLILDPNGSLREFQVRFLLTCVKFEAGTYGFVLNIHSNNV